MSMQGVPVARDWCHACDTWVVSRWGISDAHGDTARALIGAYVEDKTKTGAKRPPPFDKRREPVHCEVVRVVTERFAHLAHTEGILVCWACAIPVVLQIHARNETHDHPTEGPPTDTQTGHPPRPDARPTRAYTRTALQLNLPPQDAPACIRDCVTCIVEQRPLACGLVCHSAPCAQPARVPYEHGGLVGTPFEYRTGSMAQVYLVPPAHRFVEYDHGPLTVYDETQLRAYYRSTPDMQHPAQVFGSTPLSRQLGFPQPPSSPRHGIPAATVATTPNRDMPLTSRTSRSDDAPLLRQYHRIALVVPSRHAANPTRGGGYTARRILSHGYGGFSHDSAVCRDVCRLIARMAHPDKNLTRDAYHCAIAEVAMDTAQRASDIVASPSSSDRSAFHLLPALESAQFSAMADAHRLAKIGRPILVRSPATPSTANGGPAPALTRRLLPTMPRIPSLSLLDSTEPLSPVTHMLSATDTFPDDTPTRLQPQPAEDWCFSDAEDGDSNEDSTPGFFSPPVSVGDAQAVPTKTAATAAGRPSAFFLHTRYDPAPAAGSHRGVRPGGGSESHFLHPPYDPAHATDSHRGARADGESDSRLFHARYDPAPATDSHRGAHDGGESEPHLSHKRYELAPHLLHPRHDPVPTADSHRGARVGDASESDLLQTRY